MPTVDEELKKLDDVLDALGIFPRGGGKANLELKRVGGGVWLAKLDAPGGLQIVIDGKEQDTEPAMLLKRLTAQVVQKLQQAEAEASKELTEAARRLEKVKGLLR